MVDPHTGSRRKYGATVYCSCIARPRSKTVTVTRNRALVQLRYIYIAVEDKVRLNSITEDLQTIIIIERTGTGNDCITLIAMHRRMHIGFLRIGGG